MYQNSTNIKKIHVNQRSSGSHQRIKIKINPQKKNANYTEITSTARYSSPT
jgi:hypothetical protein